MNSFTRCIIKVKMTRETTPISPDARAIYSGKFDYIQHADKADLNLLHAERLAISGAIAHFIQLEISKRGGLLGVIGETEVSNLLDLKLLSFDGVMKVAADCVGQIADSHMKPAVDRLRSINNLYPDIFGSIFSEYENPILEIAADSQNVFDDAELILEFIPKLFRKLNGQDVDFKTILQTARNSSEFLLQRANMHGIDFAVKRDEIISVDAKGKRKFNDDAIEIIDIENGFAIRLKPEMHAVTDEQIAEYMSGVFSERVILRNQFSKKGCPARIRFNDGTDDFITYLYQEFLTLIESNGKQLW